MLDSSDGMVTIIREERARAKELLT